MLARCSSIFSSFFNRNIPDSKVELTTPLLELKSEHPSIHPIFTSLTSKLSSISKHSETYLNRRKNLTIGLDTFLAVFSVGDSGFLSYLIYTSPPSNALIHCLNTLNANLTDYCQNKDDLQMNCDYGTDDCEGNLGLAIVMPPVVLSVFAVGIYLVHSELTTYFMKKYDALDKQQLEIQLNEDEQNILKHFNITGDSKKMLKEAQNQSEAILEYLSKAPEVRLTS